MTIDLTQSHPQPQTLEEAQALIAALWEVLKKQNQLIQELREKVQHLEEKTRTNSKNSSKPPSGDMDRKKPDNHKKSSKKQGGQPGRRGVSRQPFESADVIIEQCPPQSTCECGGEVVQTTLQTRHQSIDIPPIKPNVIEYLVYKGQCICCGKVHQGQLPAGASYSLVSPGLMALIGTLTGGYRLSKRLTQSLLHDIFKVDLSVGVISKTEALISKALEPIATQAHEHVKHAPVAHCDETGHKEKHERRWMWVAVAGLVSVFLALAGRSTAHAKKLIGDTYKGIIVTDRHGAYNWIEARRRQLCWAHLLRDFTKIAERSGTARQVGQLLLEHTHRMFRYWHMRKRGEIKQKAFERVMELLAVNLENVLQQGVDCGESKTANTCKRLLKVRASLWVFVGVPGIEPTNNIAERTIRHYVLWRKLSLGTQSERGSLYAQRVMTVVGSCKLQGRNVLEFMTQALNAHFGKNTAPSLVPARAG